MRQFAAISFSIADAFAARASNTLRAPRFLFARVTLKSHRRFAFEAVGCSHLAHEVRAAAHTLDFSECEQRTDAPDKVRFILHYTVLLLFAARAFVFEIASWHEVGSVDASDREAMRERSGRKRGQPR
jgi:hypothetical protein